MNLKSAALLALIGVGLETLVILWRLFNTALAVARGLAPDITLLTAFITAFASASLLVFLFTIHRAQARNT